MTDWMNMPAPQTRVEYELRWEQWVAERPPDIQERARAYPVGKYRHRPTGMVVRIYSYNESDTCDVAVFAEDNPGRRQFGNQWMFRHHQYTRASRIKYDDLELIERFVGNPA